MIRFSHMFTITGLAAALVLSPLAMTAHAQQTDPSATAPKVKSTKKRAKKTTSAPATTASPSTSATPSAGAATPDPVNPSASPEPPTPTTQGPPPPPTTPSTNTPQSPR